MWGGSRPSDGAGAGGTRRGAHAFTWQPRGSQFTVRHDNPPRAKKFSIAKIRRAGLEGPMREKAELSWVRME